MNLIELERKLAEHKVIEKFKDGVVDGLIHGRRDEDQSHHYYNRGYDFGLVLHSYQIDMFNNHKYGEEDAQTFE